MEHRYSELKNNLTYNKIYILNENFYHLTTLSNVIYNLKQCYW